MDAISISLGILIVSSLSLVLNIHQSKQLASGNIQSDCCVIGSTVAQNAEDIQPNKI